MNDRLDYAGKYLKDYETFHYTFLERNLRWVDDARSIIVPVNAEIFGDVSFYQAPMDWDEYAKHARAIILRIGQNIWKDTEFEFNYTEAKRRGLAVGGYFFFDGRATPQQQANVIIQAMQGKSFEMELFIDWERNYGGANEGLPNVVALMKLCEAAGIKCKAVGIYTGYYWFTANSNPTPHAIDYLKTHPLWLAWYAAAMFVKVPLPWTDSGWTHWQFGTPVVDWGQPTAEVDMNKHNGTQAQFTARYLMEDTQPPPNGGTTMYGKVRTLTNIRNSPPGGTYQDIGDLLPGDEVTASEIRNVNGYDWWRLSSWKRGEQTLTLPGPECWAYGVNIEKVAPPEKKIEKIDITLMAGSTVTTHYSDGTQKVETA